MILIEFALGFLALALLIPAAIVLGECLAALLPEAKVPSAAPSRRPTAAVIVPARDEAESIARTLDALRSQLGSDDRLLVVADNCQDDTASIAGDHGAEVLERRNMQQQGKGHALDHALRHLFVEPPEIVAIVDADTTFSDGGLGFITRRALETGRPVQATYLADPAAPYTLDIQISQLAFLIRNMVRPLGLSRLGLPCALTGTGIAVPWAVIATASVATSDSAEDAQLTVELALRDHLPILCPQVLVVGCLETERLRATRQRTRWVHGHLQVIARLLPGLFRHALKRRRVDTLVLALDLSVPPLSLLLLVQGGTLAASVLAASAGASTAPAYLAGAGAVMLMAAVLLAWARFARSRIPARTFKALPFYVVRKIPIYAAFFTHRRPNWTVTSTRPASKSSTDTS